MTDTEALEIVTRINALHAEADALWRRLHEATTPTPTQGQPLPLMVYKESRRALSDLTQVSSAADAAATKLTAMLFTIWEGYPQPDTDDDDSRTSAVVLPFRRLS